MVFIAFLVVFALMLGIAKALDSAIKDCEDLKREQFERNLY